MPGRRHIDFQRLIPACPAAGSPITMEIQQAIIEEVKRISFDIEPKIGLDIKGVDLYGGTKHLSATALGEHLNPEQIKF
jgi:hypothetical protein